MKLIKPFIWMLVVLPVFFFNSSEKQLYFEPDEILEVGVVLDQIEGQMKGTLEDSSV